MGTYVPGINVSAGYLDSSGKPKDLSNATLTTLGKYLSGVTKGSQGSATPITNVYPIDDKVRQIGIVDDKGYPASLESPVNNTPSFTGGDKSSGFESKDYTKISSEIKKGLSSGNEIDGNDLLAGVAGNSGYTAKPNNQTGNSAKNSQPVKGHTSTEGKVNTYQSAVLSSNRFTSAAKSYVTTSEISIPQPAYEPSFPIQDVLGHHDADAKQYTAGRLESIGALLTMRAAGTAGATVPGADPNGPTLQSSAQLPGTAQQGANQSIRAASLYAADILSQLTKDEPPPANVLSTGTQSWGVLSTTEDPFSGVSAQGMVTLATALISGLTLVTDVMSVIMGIITPQARVSVRDSQGRYAVGEYYPSNNTGQQGTPPTGVAGALGGLSALSSNNFGALLGLQPTNYPLGTAMQAGFNQFFGLPSGGSFLTSVGSAIGGAIGGPVGAVAGSTIGSILSGGPSSPIMDSPGFLSIVCRNILRDAVLLQSSLGGIGGNIMSDIGGILAMVDVIAGSRIVGIINIWAQLGDNILSQPKDYIDTNSAGGVKTSQMDALDDVLATTANKSRIFGGTKLAWSSNRAPALVLLPSAILTMNGIVTNMGQFDCYPAVQRDPYSRLSAYVATSVDNGRIPTAIAQIMEQTLDAEYMPFYFHDVRTNEMIGFNAFLTALGDGFTAAYEKTDAYGRAEPVRIYKSTERKINMSFYIAATSQNDFDDMWIKINKLVTMVYPQYTAGVQLQDSTGQYVFNQPFSQLQGASPLIRIRLGDLFKSNYSQFGLARLFGMGNPSFQINGQTAPNPDSWDQSLLDSLAETIANDFAAPAGQTYTVAPGFYPAYKSPGGLSITISLPGGLGGSGAPDNAPVFTPQIAPSPSFFAVTAIGTPDTSPSGLGISISFGSSPSTTLLPDTLVCTVDYNTDPAVQAAFAAQFAVADGEYNNPDRLTTQFVGGQYLIPITALTPTDATKQAQISAVAVANGITADTFAASLSDFLSPSPTGNASNAIAVSFADTGGKGLAGFIESMKFDWYDKVTWETALGRAAPKICKVDITFAPIHDISPGLDSFGYDRAPVYPVGPMNQSTLPFTSTGS